MASSKDASNRLTEKSGYALFLINVILGVVLAFPFGIITASIEAVTLFGTILPISILLAVIFPILIPLIAISGVILATWHLVMIGIHSVNAVQKMVVALVRDIAFPSQFVHILSHAHEIAYMGIYGMLVIFNIKPLLQDPEVTSESHSPSCRRQPRIPLFIQDFPVSRILVLPLTPPYSDSSYTPSRRSPTCTESTDTSFSLDTPIDEHTHIPLAQLSKLLDSLKVDELSNVANYVETLKRRRSSSSLEQ